LFLLSLASALFGLALIWSATRYDASLHTLPYKQAGALAAGVVLCWGLSLVDVRGLLEKLWWVLPGLNVALLLLLIPFGQDDGTGNKSWITLPGGFLHLQPGEVVKVSFLLLLALQLARTGRDKGWRSLLGPTLHTLALCGLVYGVSGDLGMVAVYLILYGVMAWGAGVPLWWLGFQAGAGVGAVALLWNRLPDYVRLRVRVVLDHSLDPLGKGYQQERSLLAIGSGRLTGQGYLQGLQTQSAAASALPARHTDFIFSVAGEELGLFGCLAILTLLGALVLRCVALSGRGEDRVASLVLLGIGGMLGAQTALNVAMCLYAAPVVGVTLPFFSYGGSSMLSMYIAMGVISSVRLHPSPDSQQRYISLPV
jgi:rod shape determining protein RodA